MKQKIYILLNLTLVFLLYIFLGGWKIIQAQQELQHYKPAIKKMQNTLEKNPWAIVKVLEKHQNDPKAKKILFKILVGMREYQKANLVYQKMQSLDQNIINLYAGVIINLNIPLHEKLQKLQKLKLKADPRVITYYKAELYAQNLNTEKAKKLYQELLAELPETDPFFNQVKYKIKLLQNL